MNQFRTENLESMARAAIKNHKRLYGETLSEKGVMELALGQYVKQQEKQLKKCCA